MARLTTAHCSPAPHADEASEMARSWSSNARTRLMASSSKGVFGFQQIAPNAAFLSFFTFGDYHSYK